MPNDPAQKPDEKPVEQTTPEQTPEPEKGYDYRTDHNRSVDAIVKDPTPAPKAKPQEEGAKDIKPNDELTELDKTNPLEAAKKYLEEQRARDAQALEEAKKESDRRAEETVARKLRENDEAREAKARDLEDDKPIWEREGREPKDWQEVASEDRRLAEKAVLRRIREEEAATKAEAEKKQAEQTASNITELEKIQGKIGKEMEELYQGGYLPRPAKPGDPNDPGEQIKNNLFKLGVEINEGRKAQGLPPEDSIAKIFFMNKDKLMPKAQQPAGADAPVSGATPGEQAKDDGGYVYARDHRPNESFEQYARRITRQARN